MKRSELEIAGYKKRIEDLNSKIQLAQAKKREIIEYVKRLTLLHHKTKISNDEYNRELYRYLNGQSHDEWINYYDNYINECHSKILYYRDRIRKYETPTKIPALLSILVVLAILGFGVFYLQPTITGYATQVDIIIEGANNYKADELPEFNINIDAGGNLITGLAVGLGKKEIDATLIDPSGKAIKLDKEIKETYSGFNIKLEKEREFRAGLYKLRVKTTYNNLTKEIEQDFTWGVLAINVDKSIYLENEESFIGIGVLDDRGKVICNADVTLEIINPLNQKTTLTTATGDIKINDECQVLGVTLLPDYYTNYTVSGIGTYLMNLTAVTYNGVRSVQDKFTVQSSVDFDVARIGPTRIYPAVTYTMKIPIIANKNYNGIINEYVPSSFAITPQNDLTITTINDTSILSWNINLKKDEKIELSYEFNAPDISPEFYLLGPLDIGGFKEARQWQIASDAFVAIDAGWELSGLDALENDVTLTDFTSCLTDSVLGTGCVDIDIVGGNDNDFQMKVTKNTDPAKLADVIVRMYASTVGGNTAVTIYAYSSGVAIDTTDSVSLTLTQGAYASANISQLINNFWANGANYSIRVEANTNGAHIISEVSVEEIILDTTPPDFTTIPIITLDEDFETNETNLSDFFSDNTDPDTSLNYSITSFNGTSIVTLDLNGDDLLNTTGNLTASSIANLSGSETFNITVSDLAGNQNSTEIVYVINVVNDPPGIASITDFSRNEDFTIDELNISENVTDVDDPHRDINYTVTSSDTGVITVQIENGTGNFTFFSVANVTGSSTINITAYDANGSVTDGLNDSKEFIITVNPINDKPFFENISGFSVNEDFTTAIELNLSDNVSDVEDVDSNMNYTVVLTDSSVITAEFDLMNGTGNLTFRSIANITGFTEVNVTVYDSNGSTGYEVESVTFGITVDAINDPPGFAPISDFDLNANFAAFELNLSDNVTDVDDPDSDINYTVTNNNTAAITVEFDLINGTGNLTFRAVQDIQNTNATINITAYDNNGSVDTGLNDSTEFIVTIGAITNVAPEITFISENVNSTFDPLEGDLRQIEFSLIVNDSDGDADIGNVTANFTQGTTLRENVTMCIPEETGTDTASVNFTCTIALQYYDTNGDYVISVEANDTSSVFAINNTVYLTYNLLTGMNLSVNALTLAAANPDDYNITNLTDADFLNITNTGNQPGLNISVNASDLANETTIFTIPAENFTFANISTDFSGGAFEECMDSTIENPVNQTTNLVNATLTAVNGIIERGAAETSSLYLCLRHVPAGIPGVPYITLGGSWSIIVAVEP